MDVSALRTLFSTAPAIRLLQAESAPAVVAFLFARFKQARKIAVPHSELLAALNAFQEELQEIGSDALRDRPETYLIQWCDKRWLRRSFEADRQDSSYQLTSQTENVFQFLDRLLHQDLGFIGTESRLRTVIELLERLSVGASDDPGVHLEDLRRRKAEIEEQIARIEHEGFVRPYRPTRIREHFATAVDLLKQLEGDFRAVEEKFREITRQVQARHAEGMAPRGGILGEALDSEETLKQQDQGVSFFEFLRFIQSPLQQERLHRVIRGIVRIQDLSEQREGLETVRRMESVLLAEAEKVLQTTRRLSATLRRLLDARADQERRRIADVLRQIRAVAASMHGDPPREAVFVELDVELGISSPFARIDWAPAIQFDEVDLAEAAFEEDQRFELFRDLARLKPIDWSALKRHISDAVHIHGHVTLRDLVEEFHPTATALDVVAYVDVAHEHGHSIRRDAVEEISVASDEPGRTIVLRVPLVTFSREAGL